MPVTPTYPGVYIEEVPSGVRTITGVATSITAFVGRTLRGPVDEPYTINGYADFERVFGGLWTGSTLGYAVRDFYLNGGSQAIIVRLFNTTYGSLAHRAAAEAAATAVANAVTGTEADAATAAAAAAVPALPPNPTAEQTAVNAAAQAVAAAAQHAAVLPGADAASVKAAVTKAARPAQTPLDVAGLVLEAAYPGSWGENLRVTVDINVSEEFADAMGLPKEQFFNLEVTDTSPNGSSERFVNLTYENNDRRIDRVLAANSSLVRWRGDTDPSGDSPVKKADDAAKAVAAAATGADGNAAAKAARREANKYANEPEKSAAHKVAKDAEDAAAGGGDAAAVKSAADSVANSGVFSDPVTEAERTLQKKLLDDPAADVKVEKDDVKDAKDALKTSDGETLDKDSFVGPGMEGAKRGLYALEYADLFNILCIPPYKVEDGDVDASLTAQAAVYCEKRRAMLLVDPPSTWNDKNDPKQKLGQIGTRSKNAALYFPRLCQPDPLREDRIGKFVPCGAVAGIYARTDRERGVWKAPAGLDATLVGVPGLSVSLTDAENGELNPLGVNCLRARPAAGRVVWGARTVQGDDRLASEWKYVPVRRTALFIEESLYRGTQWVVFEPNDEPLWAQIRLNVGAFMHNLFRQGAFQGQTPREAYLVKCDKETTTQTDINLGIVNILVGFAPLKPAEFVIIKIQQLAGQIAV
jgi:phage tail sheath protein FI